MASARRRFSSATSPERADSGMSFFVGKRRSFWIGTAFMVLLLAETSDRGAPDPPRFVCIRSGAFRAGRRLFLLGLAGLFRPHDGLGPRARVVSGESGDFPVGEALGDVAHPPIDVVGALAGAEGQELDGEVVELLILQRRHSVEILVPGAAISMAR